MNAVLAELARALGAQPFADPVMVGGICPCGKQGCAGLAVPRADARAAEQALLRARKIGGRDGAR